MLYKLNNNLFKVIVIIGILNIVDKISGNESCWNNENECNIKTELFKNLEFSNGISMQIDCRTNLESSSQNHIEEDEDEENDFKTSTKYILLPRFMGVQSVMLDGCQTPLNTYTYGMEFLPICANITKASIRHFHMDFLIPLNCNRNSKSDTNSEQELHLKYLNIQFNEMSAIDTNSFEGNYSHLRDLLIERNSLKLIHADAFKSLRSLENLHIVNEPVLILKFADLFEYTSVVSVHLETLKQMTSGIFRHLPETLQNLYVGNTQLDNNAVVVRNSLALKNLTIKNCALQQFTLYDVHSTVKHIDLSGNDMKMFTTYENDLNELNLSGNKLEWFPYEWLTNLTNLETLILRENHIQILSLDNLLQAVPRGHIIDLRQNRLQSLKDYESGHQDILTTQVRIRCDQNLWNCLWLHEFAHLHPERFRILQYEKFISRINVNGLECIPAEKPIAPSIPQKTRNYTLMSDAIRPPEEAMNVSTYTLVYGNPWEFKRNQRAEALIIVFMLPLGIALLFLLLYMWIYCQKMFHLSYYQDFSCMRRTAVANGSQRFDVVRQLPPRTIQTEPKRTLSRILDDNDEGYEVPINGVISECNCIAQQNDELAKCQKSVHITYEQLPIEEPPHRIYEEIIHVEDGDRRNDSLHVVDDAKNFKQTYDHLSFQ